MQPAQLRRPTSWSWLIAIIGALLLIPAVALAAPPWWRVSDGKVEVWIIGVPAVSPQGLTWDTRPLEEKLKGAARLIVSPQPHGGLKAFGALLGAAGNLRSTGPMEASLPPPLRHRFDAVRVSLGKDAGHYSGWKPVIAGTMMQGDFLKANNLKTGVIDGEVRKIARRAGVAERPAGSYDGGPMIAAAASLTPSGQDTCLSSILHGMEPGAGRLQALAVDWSRGDPQVIPPDPVDLACLEALPLVKSMTDRAHAEEAEAVVSALRAPGRSLAVFDLMALSSPGGVLERLRARGLSVTGPSP
jgi:uncharacterized protein YbaP (TraB family)